MFYSSVTPMESLFLATVLCNLAVPGRWAPDWFQKSVKPFQKYCFASHGFAVFLVLLLCTGDNQWKYLPASLLVCLVYDFGAIWSAEWFTLINTVLCGFHHSGPLVAFYFQTPAEAWFNAWLYGQIWWIHGFGLIRETIMPALGLGEVEKNSSFDYWLHRVYAALTPLAYAWYVSYMPVDWDYKTLALFLQLFGRYAVGSNIVNIDWMRHIETPGVLAVFFYSYGGFKLSLPVLVLYITIVYYFIERHSGGPRCEKLVLTKEILDFVKAFPDEEAKTQEEIAKGTGWFDSQPWATKYPIFRAVMRQENDKVRELIQNGADHSHELAEWFNSVPMAWAAGGGSVSTMKILIEAGANPFHKGVLEATQHFNKTYARGFIDQLQNLARRDEDIVSRVNVDLLEAPLVFKDMQKLAQSKGGRMVTAQEARVLVAHRASAAKGDQAADTHTAACFATTEDSLATFFCKFTQDEDTKQVTLLGGEKCTSESACSLLLWIIPKEEKATESEESKVQKELPKTTKKEL